ncbi:hypothetical protein JKF63_00500 [Porcisia hertigi]|uniref:HotDog ACOT-type domain-containing protein n=1 Tax=Porcisia hertigi TaxID=2761500 RepID=A0A836HTP2_9TRYP|nr:hypothetical protein JKF63_00500 [Porcisia hertigi]
MLRRALFQAVSSRLSRSKVPAGVASSLGALSENRRTSIVIGNPKQGTVAPIHVGWTDIVGSDSTSGARLAAGRVLAMLDMCAARASEKALRHLASLTDERYLTCTVGVTNTIFSSPILHGDAVRLDGRLVHCGSSSMGIYIRFYRQSPSTRNETSAGESFFTMVAITPDLKAAKVVPAIELTDPFDIDLHNRYLRIREFERENEKNRSKRLERPVTTEEAQCPINEGKPIHARISASRVEANRIFFTSCMNNNNTVFGGELMAWMEQHAVHCGRMFTGNRHVFTIGMHSVSFPQPVFATDWVTLEATVIYVRNTTMEVDVVLKAERRDTTVVTNRAAFVLINNDDIGQKRAIPVGLELKGATQEELQHFMDARTRYQSSVATRDAFYRCNSRTGTTKL